MNARIYIVVDGGNQGVKVVRFTNVSLDVVNEAIAHINDNGDVE